MATDFFITGTDTGAGKTWTTVTLMRYLQNQGNTVVGMKPVASGCSSDSGLKNEDALLLQEHASILLPYDWINPYAYREPVSPHLAGVENPLDLNVIDHCFRQLKAKADSVLVEGAGGWLAPLSAGCDNADLAKHLNLPVIMVVAMRLGCLNHAKLTYRAIAASGVDCAGWVAVCSDSRMLRLQENIQTLQSVIELPLLGVLPFQNCADFDRLARHLVLAVKSD